MRKDAQMCIYFKSEFEDHSIWKILSEKEKKNGGTGIVSEKTEALYAELNERVEAATSNYSATGEFLQYIYFVPVAKNHQKIRSRCLVAQRCALQMYRTSLGIFILFHLQSWIILRVRTKFLLKNFHTKSDYGDRDDQNN